MCGEPSNLRNDPGSLCAGGDATRSSGTGGNAASYGAGGGGSACMSLAGLTSVKGANGIRRRNHQFGRQLSGRPFRLPSHDRTRAAFVPATSKLFPLSDLDESMPRMLMEYAVTALQLDQTNPRFPPTATQAEAIHALLDDDPQKMINLARDIANRGELSPIDPLCVVVEDGHPVVVEGNRRVGALKLLRRPSLAADAATKSALMKLAAIGKGPSKIDCHVAEAREDARHWIELRHNGELDGVGIRPWSSEQSNRFRRSKNSQADKASRFAEAVLAEFPDDHSLIAHVTKARKERLTTVGRLVGDPDVARAFGFAITEDDVVFYFDTPDLHDGFRKIFEDMAGGSVTQIKNKNHRQDYVLGSKDAVPDPARRLATPRLPGSTSAPAPTPKTKSKDRKDGKVVKPELVIFEGLRLTHFNRRTQDVLKAAQQIRIDDATPVCAVMLRVVIEMAVTEVGVPKKWFQDGEKFARKMRKALLTLDPDIEVPLRRDKSLDAAWTSSQSTTGGSGIAVEQMNAYVHNFMASPAASDLRAHSLNFRAFLERLDAYLATNP